MAENRRVAIIAAHPDDETVGAGAYLSKLPQVVFVHITDGAPRDMRDATAHGFSSYAEYAAARRAEFREALQAGGITPVETVALDCPDQEACFHLVEITRCLSRLLERLAVETVLVHPYEGGHPDHDATAFAAHAACRLLPTERRPRLVEFTSYHANDGRMEIGAFLPNHGSPESIFGLDPADRERKRRMFACYRTQQAVLQQFEITQEKFRPAPSYDFTAPPHAGHPYYEQFPWGMTVSRWMALAQIARKELGLC